MHKEALRSIATSKFIDFRIGLAGAIVMGGIVFGINYFYTHQLAVSITASLKQATYTFIFGGMLMRACEYIATNIRKRVWAFVLSVAIPSIFTLLLTYTVHSLKGTPKPMESTIPTTIIIPATAVWGLKKRKKMEVLAQMKNSCHF
jgi:hypothetical protein